MHKIIQILNVMEASDYIAIGAVIIAALSFLGQRKFNKRSEKIQKENNEISKSIFQLDKQFKNYIKEKGEQKVLDVFTHYFIIQINCWNPDGKMKIDNNSLNQYKRELVQISKELESIREENIFLLLKKNFPDIQMLSTILNDFISILETKQRIEINPDVFRIFYWGYGDLLKMIDKKNSYFNSDWHAEITRISEFLKTEIEKLAGYELRKTLPNTQ